LTGAANRSQLERATTHILTPVLVVVAAGLEAAAKQGLPITVSSNGTFYFFFFWLCYTVKATHMPRNGTFYVCYSGEVSPIKKIHHHGEHTLEENNNRSINMA